MKQDDLVHMFRVIETWAEEAYRLFGVANHEDRKAAFGLLTAIQQEARKGMQKAGAFDGLLMVCEHARTVALRHKGLTPCEAANAELRRENKHLLQNLEVALASTGEPT